MREDEYLKDEVVELSIDPLISDFSEILKIYAQAGEYAITSMQWTQFTNILRSLWNLICYYIITPTEIESSNSYKEITLIAEQLLRYLENFNNFNPVDNREGN